MIQDRVKSGLARAKANGRIGGRPAIADKIVQLIKNKRGTGLSIRKIASELGVGVSTVQRTIKAI